MVVASLVEEQTEKQLQFLSYIMSLVSICQLDHLLDFVVTQTPGLVGATECLIYLLPDLVREYTGALIGSNGERIEGQTVPEEFIVLASTSCEQSKGLIGRLFLRADSSSPSGLAFARGKPMKIMDMVDLSRVRDSSTGSLQAGQSDDNQSLGYRIEAEPVLIIPLSFDGNTLGILELHPGDKGKEFGPLSERTALMIAPIIAGAIVRTKRGEAQDRSAFELLEVGRRKRPEDAFEIVTRRLVEILECGSCELYMVGSSVKQAVLVAANGKMIDYIGAPSYERGCDLVGWICKTGRPLLIEDVRVFANEQYLDDMLLNRISPGTERSALHKESRYLKSRWPSSSDNTSSIPFLGVPVRIGNGRVIGVLCASGLRESGRRRGLPFSYHELRIATLCANSVSLALEKDLDRIREDILTRLGYLWDRKQLFHFVVNAVSEVLAHTECCIYVTDRSDRDFGLELVESSCETVETTDLTLQEMLHQLRQGKAGSGAVSQASVVINHYGSDSVAQDLIDAESRQIESDHCQDLVEELRNVDGQRVGLVQLKRSVSQDIPPEVFTQFAARLVVSGDCGLSFIEEGSSSQFRDKPTWSFMVVPIMSNDGELFGIITTARLVEATPFSPDVVTSLESIANRLASVLFSIEVTESRETLLMTLAHEIHIPLQGILADLSNLESELSRYAELRAMASHSLEQARRLHLYAETILSVLSGRNPERKFSIHSLYRPVKEATEMFQSEAAAKGCDILEPQASGPGFPDIEMSLFDLTMAFANIIHNAVKYSYSSWGGRDRSRYIRISGEWKGSSHYSVSVQNYGVEIPQAEIENGWIFKRFHRGRKASDRGRTGSGFGLAHAQQIIEKMHNGVLKVESKPIAGDAHLVTVTVTLPLKQPRQVRDPNDQGNEKKDEKTYSVD